ncbi:MAG TPA: transposase [Candidatus Acidoferrum sp.]|nr:transposase [Candidatus Acidoferrum sp.]
MLPSSSLARLSRSMSHSSQDRQSPKQHRKIAAGTRDEYAPPYSPDLNLIERVWKLTRRKCLHNRYFPVLSEVVNSIEAQFAQWVRGNITLRRLCAIT